MTTEERIAIIAKKVESDKIKVSNEIDRKNARIRELTIKVSELAPRIKELLKVRRALDKNGIQWYYNRTPFLSPYERTLPRTFETVSSPLTFGFSRSEEKMGIVDYDSNFRDIFVDEFGNISGQFVNANMKIWGLEKILELFDEFEKTFYDWVDNLK